MIRSPCLAAAAFAAALSAGRGALAEPAPEGAKPALSAAADAPPAPDARPNEKASVKAQGSAAVASKPAKLAAAPRDPTPKPDAPKDYDGREEPTTAGDVLIWIPRVIFFPAYVVTEYVVRRPLGLLVTTAERRRWIQEITELFTFGPNNNVGVVPTAVIDFGFRASGGVYFFWDDFITEGNDLRVHAATGGTDWLRLTIADRIEVDDRSSVKLRAEGWTRPDWAFFGTGPESLERNRSRYLAKTVEGGFSFSGGLEAPSSIDVYSSVKLARFGDGSCCEDPSLSARVRQGAFAATPPGFDTGYTAQRLGIEVALDSRRPRPAPGSGVRVDAWAEHAFNMEDARSRWIRYGGTLGGFLDVTGHNRVLSLAVTAQFADPLGDREVPFTELISLGGDQLMRGYLQDRLLGRSAAVATLEYRYPIWAFLDGTVQAAVGNVFGEHLAGFDPELLRVTFAAGVRTVGARDHSFDFLVGSGTETFRQGAGLHDVRLLFGATRGF